MHTSERSLLLKVGPKYLSRRSKGIKADDLKVSKWTIQRDNSGRQNDIKVDVRKVLKRTVQNNQRRRSKGSNKDCPMASKWTVKEFQPSPFSIIRVVLSNDRPV